MKKKYQIFISSTFIDLKDEREAITKAVIDMGCIPSGMESFPATSTAQLNYIQRVIDDCDYYVLLIGGRYGSLTEDGVSFTEAEYDYAVSKAKTVLAFIHSDPSSFSLSVVDETTKLRTKLSAFRAKVSQGRIVKYWKRTEDLLHIATASLHHAINDFPGVGWVRGSTSNSSEIASDKEREAQRSIFGLKNELESLNDHIKMLDQAIWSMFLEKTKPAGQDDIARWLDGAKNVPSHIFTALQLRKNIRITKEDLIIPIRYGSKAIVLIVESGVRIYHGDRTGHSIILYMDGFICQEP